MEIRPLNDLVLLRPEKNNVSAGGLMTNAVEDRATVITIGSNQVTTYEDGSQTGEYLLQLREGDLVIYQYPKKEIDIDGVKHILVSQEDILAVIK